MRYPEHQYLDLLRTVLLQGDRRVDRTGVGTLSIFGASMRFDLSDNRIPLLTTKRIPWAHAIREMLWFLSGSTNIRGLVENGVHIWTDWPLAAYRKATGEVIERDAFEKRIIEDPAFAERWGSVGRAYGAQWRDWIAADGTHHDQIATLIETLRKNPTSRRMLFHAWNVGELDQMALPPCHLLYQYHVTSDGRLNCMMTQRSVDLLLGCPWNVFETAVLQYMLAQQAGLTPGELIWSGGDVHLYLNHLDSAREQLGRTPRGAPRLHLRKGVASIDDYRIEDFIVSDYDPHPAIRAPVAV